ncbi:hypothetical protein [Propionimicrobium sp. PCR01-08-3]|uniref:hypothetical protein n=1 Tax=Propionimicrobium sp. PCR01-08-3 TaxID=3052086 RepID=UPI00255C30C6|nr:hypothetical protein [Propionimicrobium sp. PCR01-08-3]WIY83022.1 hypothetical protein QQ658_01260 [Propionimicrobium sp. PCR01-08-3]
MPIFALFALAGVELIASALGIECMAYWGLGLTTGLFCFRGGRERQKEQEREREQ